MADRESDRAFRFEFDIAGNSVAPVVGRGGGSIIHIKSRGGGAGQGYPGNPG